MSNLTSSQRRYIKRRMEEAASGFADKRRQRWDDAVPESEYLIRAKKELAEKTKWIQDLEHERYARFCNLVEAQDKEISQWTRDLEARLYFAADSVTVIKEFEEFEKWLESKLEEIECVR